jgi:hypothetical protein
MLDEVIDGALEILRKKSKNEVYFNDPVLWAEEVLGAELYSKQKEMLRSLANNKRTAVKSAHSTGKSYTMGIAACWWVSTRGSNSLVVSTAPTYNQVHNILWEEVRKHFVEHGLVGKITQDDQWKIPVEGIDDKGNKRIIEKQVAFGRRPADMDMSAFQGLHRPDGVLFLIDEAVGCPEMIFTAAEVNTTAANCRILAIANPDDYQSAFGKIFKREDSTWNRMTISVHDTPNFTGEPVSEHLGALLPQPQWVEDMKIQWGEESSRFKSKILAEFPEESDSMFFTQTAIDKSVDAEIPEDFEKECVFGVDIARMGEDYNSIYINRGGRLRLHSTWNKVTLTETAGRIHRAALDEMATEIRIDGSGIGAGVIDILMNDDAYDRKPYKVIAMIGSGRSPDTLRWLNARALYYDQMREKMQTSLLDIDPKDEKLLDEMLMIKFKFSPKGGIQIESKDDMRSRGMKSPDNLDAAVYACAEIDALINNPYSDLEVGSMVSYDPWEIMEMDDRRGMPI